MDPSLSCLIPKKDMLAQAVALRSVRDTATAPVPRSFRVVSSQTGASAVDSRIHSEEWETPFLSSGILRLTADGSDIPGE